MIGSVSKTTHRIHCSKPHASHGSIIVTPEAYGEQIAIAVTRSRTFAAQEDIEAIALLSPDGIDQLISALRTAQREARELASA